MGFSTCSMVVDDVHFHLFTFSLWLIVIVVMILNEWEWMEVVCWKMKLNLTILSFLFFLFFSAMMKTNKEWNLIRFVFILQISQIVINSRKTKPIVILFGLWFEKSWLWSNWSKWSKSQQHLQRMFWICFVLFLLFDLSIVEKKKCGKRFEICLFATIGETRERKKSVIFRIFQTGWNSLAIGLAEWLKLVAINQTT